MKRFKNLNTTHGGVGRCAVGVVAFGVGRVARGTRGGGVGTARAGEGGLCL